MARCSLRENEEFGASSKDSCQPQQDRRPTQQPDLVAIPLSSISLKDILRLARSWGPGASSVSGGWQGLSPCKVYRNLVISSLGLTGCL